MPIIPTNFHDENLFKDMTQQPLQLIAFCVILLFALHVDS